LAPAEEKRPGAKTVLFFRDVRRFSGGHLKIWDYYNHVRAMPDYVPYVRFAGETVWNESNPWSRAQGTERRRNRTVKPDMFFLGALDWLKLSPPERDGAVPIINLIQHVRHAEPETPRYRFLSRRAIRICVSDEVAQAIVATGRVNGPVLTIPLGIDLGELPAPDRSLRRDVDVLVLAKKRPDLGERIGRSLERPGRKVELIAHQVPRAELLERFRRARVTVFLPHPTEGFYIPPLEGMALGTIVVCPDCVGNRSFCLPGSNCFFPDYSEDDVVQAAEAALQAPDKLVDRLIERGFETAGAHNLTEERASFMRILERLDELWMGTES
jgi:hypothetical protein